MPQELPGVTSQIPTARWAAIKLLAIDVDGVLTDGGLTFNDDGQLWQTFYVRDGFALIAAKRAGVKIAWISGRASPTVQKRFEELDLDFCLLACADKFVALRDLQAQLEIMPGECCFIGDDLPDLPAFAACGLNAAVADAVPEVIEHILQAQGHWSKLVAQFSHDEFDGMNAPASENLQR